MRKLKSDFNDRSRGGGDLRAPRMLRALLPGLMFLSVGLLILSRLDHTGIRAARWHMTELLSPVLNAALVPLQPVRSVARRVSELMELSARIETLEAENRELKSWRWRAEDLQRRLTELEQMAKAVAEPSVGYISAQVIANSSGSFVRSAVINAGREHNLKVGYPVVNADGLVGRIVEMGRRASSVLLLNDLNSRIPVVVGGKRVRAVMVGDNGPLPRLIFVGEAGDIAAGDEVATSGVGGIFPRGVKIGVVVGSASELKVQPAARLDELEYLKVLLHESAALQLTDDTPPTRSTEAAGARRGPAAGVPAVQELQR